jgi:hypothetical protein
MLLLIPLAGIHAIPSEAKNRTVSVPATQGQVNAVVATTTPTPTIKPTVKPPAAPVVTGNKFDWMKAAEISPLDYALVERWHRRHCHVDRECRHTSS